METQKEIREHNEKVYELAGRLDADAPYIYRIKRGGAGRFHCYRTKAVKYKARTTEKIKTFKTLALAHKYMGKVEKRNYDKKKANLSNNPT